MNFAFDFSEFASKVSGLAKKFGQLRLEEVSGELCPVDILEAGFELEKREHLQEADQVFDLTLANFCELLKAA